MEYTFYNSYNSDYGPELANWYHQYILTVTRPPNEYRPDVLVAITFAMSNRFADKFQTPEKYMNMVVEMANTTVFFKQLFHKERYHYALGFYFMIYSACIIIPGVNVVDLDRRIRETAQIPHYTIASAKYPFFRMNMYSYTRALFIDTYTSMNILSYKYYTPADNNGIEPFLKIVSDMRTMLAPSDIRLLLPSIPDNFGNIGEAKTRQGPWVFYALAISLRNDVIETYPQKAFLGGGTATYTPYINELVMAYFGNQGSLPSPLSVRTYPEESDFEQAAQRNIAVLGPIIPPTINLRTIINEVLLAHHTHLYPFCEELRRQIINASTQYVQTTRDTMYSLAEAEVRLQVVRDEISQLAFDAPLQNTATLEHTNKTIEVFDFYTVASEAMKKELAKAKAKDETQKGEITLLTNQLTNMNTNLANCQKQLAGKGGKGKGKDGSN